MAAHSTASMPGGPPPRDEERGATLDELYRALFEHSADAVLIAKPDGTIVRANAAACRAYGLSEAEVRGLGRAERVVDGPALRAFLARRDATGAAAGALTIRRGDGTFMDVEVTSSLILTAGGERYTSVIFRDVTERKRAEEELREADRRKNEFLAVLSHELRNPLAPIRNSMYILDRAAAGSEQASRAKQVMARQVDHLTRIVDDLLDVTRVSRGKIALQRTILDLRDVVRKTTDDMLSTFARARIELRVDCGGAPVWIHADRTRIRQVLGNLLQNAVRFTAEDGVVSVEVAATERGAELRVRDSGIGMEPGTIERMFEPFAQAERTLARTKGGLGLGLALVKGLVELHGGAVEARSGGIGRGSEFVVRLPSAG